MIRRAAPSDLLQICFWGTRGSSPVSGSNFCEFGGHTPCVEIRCGERLFIVDAGTGLTSLGEAWGNELPAEVDILLSHLHLDHVGGFPFFKPAVLNKDRVIHTWCGNLGGESAEEGLDRLFSPPIFPINLERLPARFRHHGFKAGETLTFQDGATVETHLLNHPGGATGFRFRHAGRSVCYISDIEHTAPWPDPALVAFVRGADLVIFDGMFTEIEYPRCQGWGHSTWQKGVELCEGGGVKALAIFHLYPGHNDAYLRKLEAEMQAVMPTAFIARENQTFSLKPQIPELVLPEAEPVKLGA
ncbi:MAG: MBL fold metallo-hydrolase [Microvirga sp.]